MKIHLTGLNHRTAPVEVRERFAISEAALPEALERLRQAPGVDETLILSTCNRVEIIVAADDGADPGAVVEDFLASLHPSGRTELAPHLYAHSGDDAIRHLFRVASSLDSMVLGEPQVLGQLKQAYAAAKQAGALQGPLDDILTRAFSVAKRVRTETDVGRSPVSVSFAAIELARQIFGRLDGRKALLLGAGKMSELSARHLRRAGCSRILVANRTFARAEELAAAVEGTPIDYESFPARLPEIDIVVASTGAQEFVLTAPQIQRVQHARRNRPLFLIDIAVPRNVDPAVNELEGVFLYDIDDLGRAVEENRRTRAREAAQAEALIEEEVRRLAARRKAREAGPLIVSLQQQLDALAAAELDRMRPRLGALTPEQQEVLQCYTRSLLNKIAHGPITELRRAAAEDSGSALNLIRRMFRLDE
jgi:glutamyl-tRNA reductase